MTQCKTDQAAKPPSAPRKGHCFKASMSIAWRAWRLGGAMVAFRIQMGLILICALPLTTQAEPLGRLFHTPEQRAMLDLARKSTPLSAAGEIDPASGQGLSVTGVVTRSDGRRSTWVNGRVEHDAGVTRNQDRSQVWVKVPGGDVKLKVGQSLDPATGQVAEGYRRAPPSEPVTTKPAPPKTPTKPIAPATRDDNAEPDQPAAQ